MEASPLTVWGLFCEMQHLSWPQDCGHKAGDTAAADGGMQLQPPSGLAIALGAAREKHTKKRTLSGPKNVLGSSAS